jgi:hypothetical protein
MLPSGGTNLTAVSTLYTNGSDSNLVNLVTTVAVNLNQQVLVVEGNALG